MIDSTFTHDIIYVETIRVTDNKLDNPDKQGDSNVAQIKIKLAIDETDVIMKHTSQRSSIPAPVLDADYLIGITILMHQSQTCNQRSTGSKTKQNNRQAKQTATNLAAKELLRL
jgi:hypothetical protein